MKNSGQMKYSVLQKSAEAKEKDCAREDHFDPTTPMPLNSAAPKKSAFEPPTQKKIQSSSPNSGTCKCSQTKLVEIISGFSQEQKGAIEKSGFGSLLKLNKQDIRRDLCKDIANAFDLETKEFNIGGNRVKICIEDVAHILDLPSKGDEIKEPPQKHVRGLFEKYAWKDATRIDSKPLTEYLTTNTTYGDDFIRIFLLYTIGFYLCPTLQPYVKSEYLGLIEKVDTIKDLNWSSLVLNFLISSIREYREKKATNLKGNLALLQVWYWEKLSMSHICPSLQQTAWEKPLMQFWDENRAKERCKEARKYPFGEGKIVDDITRPEYMINKTTSSLGGTSANQTDHEQTNALILKEIRLLGTRCETLTTMMGEGFTGLDKRVQVLEDKRREEENTKTVVLEDNNICSPAKNKKKNEMSLPKQQARSSNRQKKPIQQSNDDFDYGTNRKRKRPNKKKPEDEMAYIEIPDGPLPTDSTSPEYMCNAEDMHTVQYINSSPKDKILVIIDTHWATKTDLECLLDCSLHVHSSVVNAYIRILKRKLSIQKREDGEVYLETTFNSSMIGDDTVASLKNYDEHSFRLVRTLTYLRHDMVFFPINVEQTHWYLAVINAPKRVIQILDSAGTATHRPKLHQLIRGLQNHLKRLQDLKLIKNHKWKDVRVNEWPVNECVINIPMQTDQTSCGLFMLKYMELWTGNRLSTNFTQKDMTNFRNKLGVTIVDYEWNQEKGSPGYKSSKDVENYTPKDKFD